MSDITAPGLLVPIGLDDANLRKRMEANVKFVDDGFGHMVTRAQATAARLDASFGRVTLAGFRAALAETAAIQDRVVQATLKGEKDVVTSLNAELAVRGRVNAAAVAQLQTQLAVANATGSRKQAKELEEVLALQQRLTSLRAAGVTGTSALREAGTLAAATAGAEAPSLKRAATSLFDSTRLATLEEGGARLRLFGSALEPLGPYGLAAAAGVVALGEALAKTHEAIEYADGLYKAAAAAHTTTTELQVMREALQRAGGEATNADQALLQFSTTFGKAQDGLARDQRGFRALGFSSEQIKAFKDSGQALDAVVAKIRNLRKPSDQDAAIDLLGLQGLAPLILKGRDAWKEYRAEAEKSVLPPEVIERGHELNTQIDELTRKIKNDLTEAFINLGPILVGILKPVEALLERIKDFSDWVANHPAIGKLAGDVAKGAIGGAVAGNPLGGLANPIIAKDVADVVHQATTKAEFGAAKPLSSEQYRSSLGIQETGDGKLHDVTDSLKESTDRLIEAQKAALGRAADELKARQALTGNVQLRAQIEDQLADNALAQHALDLKKQVADARIDAAQGKIPAAAAAQVESEAHKALLSAQIVAELTKELRARQARFAADDQADETANRDRAARLADLQLQRGATTSLDEQNAIDRQILRTQQGQALQAFRKDLARRQESGELSPEEATQRRDAFLQEQADARAAQDRSQVGRFIAFADSRRQDAVAIQSAELERAKAHVDALAGLADTLKDRTRLEREALDRAQDRERLLAQAEVDRAKAEAALAINAGDPEKLAQAQAHLSAALASQAALPGQQALQNANFDKAHEGPIAQYVRAVQDLNTAVQGDAVNAFRDLTSGLIDAAIHARNAGDVIRNVFLNLAQEILTQTLQKEAVPGLAAVASIFGLADGGQVRGPGTSRSDSIPAMLSDGEFVVNAAATRAHLPLLAAINSGRVGRYADGGLVTPSFPALQALAKAKMPQAGPQVVLAQPLHFDLRGAVMTEDLLRQMQGMAARSGQVAYSRALRDASAALPGQQRSQQLLDN